VKFAPSWNIAQSTRICTITADQAGGRHLLGMKRGLIPSWAKEASIGNKLTNARGGTVAEKPSFRSAFRQRRCIIPASGFYEWKAAQGMKQPWYVSLKSGETMAFAGLWKTWHTKEQPFQPPLLRGGVKKSSRVAASSPLQRMR
jgi:putative SOS response-associated peptidase YedK